MLDKKIFGVILGILIILAISQFHFEGSVIEKGKTIRIGAVLPLTGAAGFNGEQARDGMTLAVDEINEQGGINGFEIELILEDSKTNPSEGLNAYNNLILHDPDAVISALSAVAITISPVTKDQGIPHIGIIATTNDLTTNDWSFRYFSNAESEVDAFIEVAERLETDEIGVIYLNDEFGVSTFNKLKEKFHGKVYGESYLLTTGDFKTEITKIALRDPDAIIVIGFSGHLVNLVKQMKELDVNIPVMGPSTFSLPEVRQALGELGDGIYFGSPIYYENAKAAEFNKRYEEIYGKKPDHMSANGYDVIYLLKEAIETSGDKSEIVDGLLGTKEFEGLLGKPIIKGRDFTVRLYPATMANGEIIFLS